MDGLFAITILIIDCFMSEFDNIKQALESKLNSKSWEELKSSFIGSELITYGTLVAYQSRLQVDMLRRNMHTELADESGLLDIAYTKNLPIDSIRPASVTISLDSPAYLPPFSIVAAYGKVLYTNLDFYKSGQSITLYQGNLKTMFTNQIVEVPAVEQSFVRYYSQQESAFYLKLGQSAYSYYIQLVSSLNGAVRYLTLYDALIANPEANVYKLKRGYDRSLNAYFGNGIWGAQYDTLADYQVTWLDATTTPVDITKLVFTVNGQTQPATILAYSAGSDSVENLRLDLNAKLAKFAGIATESQIRSAVNSYEVIVDSQIDHNFDNPNLITIYVKPTDPEQTTFDTIQDMLNLKGEFVTQYDIQPGTPLSYVVYLSSSDILTIDMQTRAIELVKDYVAYLKQPYVVDVTTLSISELLKDALGINVIVQIKVSEPILASSTLSILPRKSTIQIYEDGVQTGWDAEGTLYAAIGQASLSIGSLYWIQDYLFDSTDSKTYALTESFENGGDVTSQLDFSKVTSFNQRLGYFITQTGNSLSEYLVTNMFRAGEQSILLNPYIKVNPLATYSNSLDLTNTLYDPNSGIYKPELQAQYWYLTKYEKTTGYVKNLNYTVALSTAADWTLTGILLLGDNLIVAFREGWRFVDGYLSPSQSVDLSLDSTTILKDNIANIVGFDYSLNPLVLIKTNVQFQLVRLYNPQIIGTTTKTLSVAKEEVIFSYNGQSIPDYKVVHQTMDTVYLQDLTNNILYAIKPTYNTEVTMFNPAIIQQIGVVDYSTGKITLSTQLQEQLEVEYEPSLPLSTVAKNVYPVNSDVSWI